jgi:multiple sugar transport system ATP-binding protein
VDVAGVEPKDRGIGMVFQSYALYPHMTVAQNLAFALKVAGMPKAEIARRVASAAELLQLGPLLSSRPAVLSGGQRQRVAIGRALVRDVAVYLLDEPLSNLDAQLRAELRVELKRLHRKLHKTMVYVTHDQVEAMTLADRLVVLNQGRIQQIDAPVEVFRRPANRFVASFIGSPQMNFIDGSLSRSSAGWELNTRCGRFSLEYSEVDAAATLQRDVTLGVRPEHLLLSAGTGAEGGPKGEVTLTQPMGSQVLVWVSCGGLELSCLQPLHSHVAAGDFVRLGVDARFCSWFDPQSGLRI